MTGEPKGSTEGIDAPTRSSESRAPEFVPIALPGGQAAVVRRDGQVIRLGWPELGGPMFYPSTAVEVADDRVRVVHDMGALGEAEEWVDLQFRWAMSDDVSDVQPYIMYGQSLAMNLGHDQSITAAPIAPGRVLRYANAGPGAQMSVSDRPGHDKHDFGPCHFPSSDLDRLEDLHEERGESPVSAAVEGFLPALAGTTGVVATNHARGGMAINKLMPKRLAEGRGTGIQYAGILRGAIRTRQFCDMHGCTMRQPLVSFIQGENFQPDDWQRYPERLLALQAALTEDLGRITDRAEEVMFFVDQTCVMSDPNRAYHPKDIPASLAQLRVAQKYPDRFICVGPKYFLPRRSTLKGRGDPVHLLATASRLLGDYHGRAIRQTMQGQRWMPLHAVNYRRDGAVIRLGVEGGDGSPLALDTELVRNTRESLFGFRWIQEGGNIPQVSAVSLSDRQIEVKLGADPGKAGSDFGRAALTIGMFSDHPHIDQGPLTGGRTNVRDSCPDVSRCGQPMFNWLCHDWFWETGEPNSRGSTD